MTAKYPVVLFIMLFLSAGLSYGQPQARLLSKAYGSGSPNMLQQFIDNWAKETAPLPTEEIDRLHDSVREVYQLYRQFYDPMNIEKTGGSEWGNHIYSNVKYLLVQATIQVGFVDILDKDILLQKEFERIAKKLHIPLDSVIAGHKANAPIINRNFQFVWPTPKKMATIHGFRPQTKFRQPVTLVLTPAYDSLLNSFLGNSHHPLGAGNIMAPAASKRESEKRQQFLENYIKIWYGHWGGYWQLYSYPFVNGILFDRTLTHALINYRMVYEGGYAYFKKDNGVWTLVEAQRTWIE